MAFPKIITLCGSTRFYEQFQEANFRETMNGNIVLSVGFFPHSSKKAHGEEVGITVEDKIKLDELHKRKIDISDEIFVINVGGYIGESTRSEIEYAHKIGVPVNYLEYPDQKSFVPYVIIPNNSDNSLAPGEWNIVSYPKPDIEVEVLLQSAEIAKGFIDQNEHRTCWKVKKKGDHVFWRRFADENQVIGWR